MDEYSLGCALLGRDLPVETLMERIRAVTKAQLRAAAQKLSVDTIYFLRGTEE